MASCCRTPTRSRLPADPSSTGSPADFRGFFERNLVVARRHVPGLVSVLAVLAVLCVVNLHFLPEITLQRPPPDEELNEKWMNLALALERFTTPDATVGVFAAGTVPYYSGRPAIDFLGKMEPRIVRLAPDLEDYWSPRVVLQPSRTTPKIVRPGHNKYDLECGAAAGSKRSTPGRRG